MSTELERVASELDGLRAEAEALLDAERHQTGTALAVVTERSPVQLKQQLARTRAALARKQAEVEAKAGELRALMDSRLAEANRVLAPLRAQMALMEEGIWTINLYLGRDETLVQLRDGEPAPATTPIVVRQQVLAMDEESAVAAEEGGIDARDVETFDAWLLADSAHLDQVLPETKGVVALMPRRKTRDYGDPWVQSRMDDENAHTYFLIRNGERLFRTTTADFKAGRRLIPARDEFTAMFTDRDGAPIKPGSYRWDEAEAAAGDRQRHFMRVALILQGLVDRTTVFHPLPGPVDLLTPPSYDAGHVRIVMDDDLQLTTGSESFRDWRRRLAGQLRVGMRVVGAFNTDGWRYANHGDQRQYGTTYRVHPNGAPSPDTGVLYTLEDRTQSGFVIRYDRQDKRYGYEHGDHGQWGEWPYKVRASATIRPADEWVLPFDLADVDTMRRFLTSRENRGDYAEMFPVLKAAIAAKEAEAELEAPFVRLVAGRVLALTDVDQEAALTEARALLDWWKFTTRYHRPVLAEAMGDDQVANHLERMLEEHGRRQAAAGRTHVDIRVVGSLRARHPGALLVARKRDGSLVVLVPSAPDQNVYVDQYAYTTRGRPAAAGRSSWHLVGSRCATWTILWESDAWATWDRMASRSEHLTGPEVEALVPEVLERVVREGEVAVAVAYTEDRKYRDWSDVRRLFQVYVTSPEPMTLPTAPDQHAKRREVTRRPVEWRRTSGGAVKVRREGWYAYTCTWPHRRTDEQADPWDEHGTPRWLDHDLAATLRREHAAVTAHNEVADEWHEAGREALRRIHTAWLARAEQAEYDRFLEDFADPDLWDGHRKTLRLQYPHHREDTWLLDVYRRLLLAGRDPAGMTVADAVRLDDDLHHVPSVSDPDEWGDRSRRINEAVYDDLAALVLPEPEAAEPDDDEDDDLEDDEP